MFEFFQPISRLTEVAQDIYTVPFLTEDACIYLVELGRASDRWKRNNKENGPALLDLHEELPIIASNIEYAFYSHLVSKIERIWPVGIINQMFMVYYSKNIKANLKAPHEGNYITIRLNNEYTGAEETFSKQKFSDKDVPIGEAIIWPSQITHPYQCTELQSGEKFLLTLLTGAANPPQGGLTCI